MPVGGDLCRTASSDGLGTAEAAWGGGPIWLRAQHRVDQLPLFVDGSIQIHPLATHLYIRLLQLPTTADLAVPSAPNLFGQ